jgi:Reverse transcriptase (RNA-dependent DNA polymerase)
MRINQRLHRLAYPMPRTDQVFNSLRNKRLFNVLDMANAYLSVPLSQDTNYIASFVIRRGQFKFLKMPAGLASAGSVFNQLIMQRVFNDMCWSDICCFVDDLVCPCSSVDEGMRFIEEIFRFGLVWFGFFTENSVCQLEIEGKQVQTISD